MYIYVYCLQTEQDRAAMVLKGTGGATNTLNNINGPQIDYNPPEGFPLYYFIQKVRNSAYIHPAVMVQFNTLQVNKQITVKCTAWSQNFNNGKPQESEDYSVDIIFNLYHE